MHKTSKAEADGLQQRWPYRVHSFQLRTGKLRLQFTWAHQKKNATSATFKWKDKNLV